MLSKPIVKAIKQDLIDSDLSITFIANKYDVNRKTIANINDGITYRQNDISYPLRKPTTLTKNEEAFIIKYRKQYTPKHLYYIINKGTLNAIMNIYLDDSLIRFYSKDDTLESRRRVLDVMITPSPQLVNSYSYLLTLEDYQYIQLLSKLEVPIEDILYIFIELISFETEFDQYPITTKEQLGQYYYWSARKVESANKIIAVADGRFKNFRGEVFSYMDIDLERFCAIDKDIDLTIVESIISLL